MSPDNGSSGTIKMIQLRKMDEKSRLFDRNDVHVSTIYTFVPIPFQTTSNLNLLHVLPMRWLHWKIQRNRKRLTVVTVLHHVHRLFVLKLRCVSFGAQHKPIYYTVTRYLSTME